MPLITILTPTYNRSALLPRVFDSLCRQTCQDFEWIVVDDGSEDNSKFKIQNLKLSAQYPIRYFYKENGGKHTAVNYGVKKAAGELTLILDSDDELPPTAVADIITEWEQAKELKVVPKPLGGICGYMAHRNGEIIGHPTVDTVCDEFSLRYNFNVKGDMCEVFRTDVLREFPFPEIEGEKFCPEALDWNRIATKYSLKVFPKVIYLRDYLDGGLTDNIVRIRMQSPVLACMTYSEMLDYDIPYKQREKAAINYWRFRYCAGKGSRLPKIGMRWLWACVPGWLAHLRDKNLTGI